MQTGCRRSKNPK